MSRCGGHKIYEGADDLDVVHVQWLYQSIDKPWLGQIGAVPEEDYTVQVVQYYRQRRGDF